MLLSTVGGMKTYSLPKLRSMVPKSKGGKGRVGRGIKEGEGQKVKVEGKGEGREK